MQDRDQYVVKATTLEEAMEYDEEIEDIQAIAPSIEDDFISNINTDSITTENTESTTETSNSQDSQDNETDSEQDEQSDDFTTQMNDIIAKLKEDEIEYHQSMLRTYIKKEDERARDNTHNHDYNDMIKHHKHMLSLFGKDA